MTSTSALDWADLCPQTVIWNPTTGRDQYGKPQYNGISQEFRGRRVYKYSRVAAYERGTKGQGPENISESQIWILGNADVKYDDQVYIEGDTAPYPPVLSVQNYPDEDGPLYTKVYLGSANG